MTVAPAVQHYGNGSYSRFNLEERLVITVIDGSLSRLEEDLYHANIEDGLRKSVLSDEEVERLRENGHSPDTLMKMSIVDGFMLRQLAIDPASRISEPLKSAILTVFPDDKAFGLVGTINMSSESFNLIASLAPQIPGMERSYEVPTVSLKSPDQSPAP